MKPRRRAWSELSEDARQEAIARGRAHIASRGAIKNVVWHQLIRLLDLRSPDGLRLALDPEYGRKRREQTQSRRSREKCPSHHQGGVGRVKSADVAARLAEIPPDTRTITGMICGDPLPGRSALDRSAAE
ncbi:MAG: hypothetical protein GY788_17325 [bacterium]|nr:hypothetical protein [bacterium]